MVGSICKIDGTFTEKTYYQHRLAMTIEGDINGLLSNSRVNFCHIDQLIVCKFDENILSKINNFFLWLEEQKDIGKKIIRNETGLTRLPKTPKRGYCFSQEAETFQKCRKKLLDSVKRKGAAIFANDGNTAICAAQTPKSSRNTTARAVKQETMLAGQMNQYRKIPIPSVPAPRQYIAKQETPIKVNKYPPVTTSSNNTPKRTPLRNGMTPKITAQKTLVNSEATARKITVTPKATVQRTALTPKMADKKITVTPKAIIQQPTFNRSEVIRKMEKRTNTVIKNKEELMKEKAERARRDREERALRVKMNNKKKEEETLEKLRIIKMREQQIEELRQKQRMPQRAISKSPCRTRAYYNRIQKPLVRAKSSQDVSVLKNASQREMTNDTQENLQLQGKRNHLDSVKQDIDIQNKRQKMESVECSETDDTDRHSIRIDTPEKVLSEEPVDVHIHTECPESDEKRNSEDKGNSQNSIYVNSESNETAAVTEQEMLGSLRNCDVSPDIVVHSSVVESSEINEKENVDEASQVMEVDILTAETSGINNQTFDKSLNVSKNETLDDIGNNYDVESISSNDETDDEENPRKPIPLWAQGQC
uniref:INCENP_ARK-bind domain-containing protein n=1 Tax=Wuchereria bancrofti TaxID=6293 RepID=A0A1I8ENR9_WUCBA